MAYSIIKKTWKCNEKHDKIGDEIELIESHDRYMRATKHYKKVVQGIKDSIDVKCTSEYNLGNDLVCTINGEHVIIDVIFTDERNVIKYL